MDKDFNTLNKEFNIGDKVRFKGYGFYDCDSVYTIVDKSSDELTGGYVYGIDDGFGYRGIAFADELILDKEVEKK